MNPTEQYSGRRSTRRSRQSAKEDEGLLAQSTRDQSNSSNDAAQAHAGAQEPLRDPDDHQHDTMVHNATSSASRSRSAARPLTSATGSSTPLHPSNQMAENDPRPTALKFKPKAALRRSKEERDAIERAELERAASTGPSVIGNSSLTARGRGQELRGRGTRHFGRMILSGPSSGPLGASDAPVKSLRSKTSKTRAADQGSEEEVDIDGEDRQSTSEVKKEPTDKSESQKETKRKKATTTAKRKRGGKVKKEDEIPTYVSSEAEFDSDTGRKINIEQINLISSEDEEDTDDNLSSSEVAKGKQRELPFRPRSWMMRPVFIQRQEHVDRSVGLNTEASSLTSAELRKRAKARQDAGGSLFLSDDDDDVVVLKGPEPKARRKPKDVEFLRDERKWKGVWTAEDDPSDTQVKEEPLEDEYSMAIDTPTDGRLRASNPMVVDDDDGNFQADYLPESQGAGKKGLPLGRKTLPVEHEYYQTHDNFAMSSLYTRLLTNQEDDDFADIDEQELANDSASWYEEMRSIQEQYRAETLATATQPHISVKDDLEQAPSKISGRPYLVQLPSKMPMLYEAGRRKDSIKSEHKPSVDSSIEEKKTPGNAHAQQGLNSTDIQTKDLYTRGSKELPKGTAGTLTFYASGKTAVTWGGMQFEINEETQAPGQAREVFITERNTALIKGESQTKWEEVVKLGGESKTGAAVGQVYGSLTGVPDLGALLG